MGINCSKLLTEHSLHTFAAPIIDIKPQRKREGIEGRKSAAVVIEQ